MITEPPPKLVSSLLVPVNQRRILQALIARELMTPCTLLPTEIGVTQRWIKVLEDWDKQKCYPMFSRYSLFHPEIDGITYNVMLVERRVRPDTVMLQDGFVLCHMKGLL